jgi:hypothetical protein
MSGRDWVGAVCLTSGLAVFVLLTPTASGRDSVPAARWLPTLLLAGAAAAVLVRFATGRGPASRAAALGAASGCLFAVTAALTKAALGYWSDGVFRMVAHWELYALIAVALVGAVTVQSAFQAGPLAASLPMLTAVEPLVGAVLGVALFEERLLRRATFAMPLPLVLAAIGYGIVVLGRSPVVAQDERAVAARPG